MTIEQMKESGKNTLTLVTHHKGHHADDVMAGALLTYFLSDKLGIFTNVKLNRVDYNKFTGNKLKDMYSDEISTAIVYDVGGIYDPNKGLFDHHQFTNQEDSRASAGMVFDWLVEEGAIDSNLEQAMRPLIKMIDDNDIGIAPSKIGELSWIIRHMNVSYECDDFKHNVAYKNSVGFVIKIIKSLDKANEELLVTAKKFQEAKKVLETKKFFGLEFASFPKNWQTFVNNNKHPNPKELDIIVWFNEPDNTWQAQTVNVSPTDFTKVGRNIQVDDGYINDVENGITFVHKGEFFMVTKTKEALYKYLNKYLDI